MRRILVFVIAFFSFGSYCFGLTIVRDTHPVAKIIIDKSAPHIVKFAASELQKYIEKVSDAKLEISDNAKLESDQSYIFVGESKFSRQLGLDTKGLKLDGYKIIARKNWLALFGRDYKGDKLIEGLHHPFQKGTSYNRKLKINRFQFAL